MVKFKGHLSFSQYMLIMRGIKAWNLCESDTGYAYHLQVYTGRENGQQENGLTCVHGPPATSLRFLDPLLDGQFLHLCSAPD